MSPSTPRIFFLVGPTAVGKTEIAAKVASECNCEVISADAFQVYQGMDILTAKPSPDLLEKVPHHVIGIIPPSQSFDVAQFHVAASQAIKEIHSRGKFPLVAGGTGLYVRALTHGLADLPKADPAIRIELEGLRLTELQSRYEALDPQGAKLIDRNNQRRLIRAIEVCLITGKPFSSFRKEWETRPENIAGIFLQRDRVDLYKRIDQRTLEMVRSGLFEEVQALGNIGPTASQVIGLREARAYLEGQITQEQAVAQIQQSTRNYAKRQMTWFRRESHFQPLDIGEPTTPDLISRELRNFYL